MKRFQLFSATLWAMVSICAAQNSNDINVSYGEITDLRTSAQNSTLNINVKLSGDAIRGAQQLHAEVNRALDDTGKDLLGPHPSFSVTKHYEPGVDQPECTIQLRNPARRATTVKILEGEISAFVAKNDPAATVSFEHVISQSGTSLTNEALRAAEVEISLLNKEQFDAMKQQELDESVARHKNLGSVLGRPFPFHSRYAQVDDNAIVLKISDPKSKVVGIEFVDGDGKMSRPRHTMSTEDLRIFDFNQKPSAEMAVKILLSTAKSVVKVPFSFADIPLP